MNRDTLEIFKNRLALDLEKPPQKRADWGLARLAIKYGEMDTILQTVANDIRKYWPDDGSDPDLAGPILMAFQGRAEQISKLGLTLKTGVVTIPVGEVDGQLTPLLDVLKDIFSEKREERKLKPEEQLEAILLEDIVGTGVNPQSLGIVLRWNNVQLLHVSCFIEDLRKDGRRQINNPFVSDKYRSDGVSFSSVGAFDPVRGLIDGTTTEGIKLEENRGLIATTGGGAEISVVEQFTRGAQIINEASFENQVRSVAKSYGSKYLPQLLA